MQNTYNRYARLSHILRSQKFANEPRAYLGLLLVGKSSWYVQQDFHIKRWNYCNKYTGTANFLFIFSRNCTLTKERDRSIMSSGPDVTAVQDGTVSQSDQSNFEYMTIQDGSYNLSTVSLSCFFRCMRFSLPLLHFFQLL